MFLGHLRLQTARCGAPARLAEQGQQLGYVLLRGVRKLGARREKERGEAGPYAANRPPDAVADSDEGCVRN